MFAYFIHQLFFIYTILIAVRIIGSWFPKFVMHPLFRLLARITDPYLNIFRRIIPPIGGTLDLSPILAFIGLRVAEAMILGLIR